MYRVWIGTNFDSIINARRLCTTVRGGCGPPKNGGDGSSEESDHKGDHRGCCRRRGLKGRDLEGAEWGGTEGGRAWEGG